MDKTLLNELLKETTELKNKIVQDEVSYASLDEYMQSDEAKLAALIAYDLGKRNNILLLDASTEEEFLQKYMQLSYKERWKATRPMYELWADEYPDMKEQMKGMDKIFL